MAFIIEIFILFGPLYFASDSEEMKPYPVAIGPELVTRLEDCLTELNLKPQPINGTVKVESAAAGSTNVQSILVCFVFFDLIYKIKTKISPSSDPHPRTNH